MVSKNMEMINIVSAGLGQLNNELLYVGGSVVELYVDQNTAGDIRVTEDVDLVVQISSRGDFYKFEENIRKLGFKNDISTGVPICRWIFKKIKVDFMPADMTILGFSNKWYDLGFKKKEIITLDNGIDIYILPLIIYLATKIEAVFDRGIKDLRLSHDFEDAIYLLENSKSFKEFFVLADPITKSFLTEKFNSLIKMSIFREALVCTLPYGADATDIDNILKKINWICNFQE